MEEDPKGVEEELAGTARDAATADAATADENGQMRSRAGPPPCTQKADVLTSRPSGGSALTSLTTCRGGLGSTPSGGGPSEEVVRAHPCVSPDKPRAYFDLRRLLLNLGGVTFSQGLVSRVKSSISVRSVCAGPSLCRRRLHMPVDISLTSPDGGRPAEPYANNATADMFYQSLEAVALQ